MLTVNRVKTKQNIRELTSSELSGRLAGMTELTRNSEHALPEGVTETDQQYVTRLEDLLTYFENKYNEAWYYAEEAYK